MKIRLKVGATSPGPTSASPASTTNATASEAPRSRVRSDFHMLGNSPRRLNSGVGFSVSTTPVNASSSSVSVMVTGPAAGSLM